MQQTAYSRVVPAPTGTAAPPPVARVDTLEPPAAAPPLAYLPTLGVEALLNEAARLRRGGMYSHTEAASLAARTGTQAEDGKQEEEEEEVGAVDGDEEADVGWDEDEDADAARHATPLPVADGEVYAARTLRGYRLEVQLAEAQPPPSMPQLVQESQRAQQQHIDAQAVLLQNALTVKREQVGSWATLGEWLCQRGTATTPCNACMRALGPRRRWFIILDIVEAGMWLVTGTFCCPGCALGFARHRLSASEGRAALQYTKWFLSVFCAHVGAAWALTPLCDPCHRTSHVGGTIPDAVYYSVGADHLNFLEDDADAAVTAAAVPERSMLLRALETVQLRTASRSVEVWDLHTRVGADGGVHVQGAASEADGLLRNLIEQCTPGGLLNPATRGTAGASAAGKAGRVAHRAANFARKQGTTTDRVVAALSRQVRRGPSEVPEAVPGSLAEAASAAGVPLVPEPYTRHSTAEHLVGSNGGHSGGGAQRNTQILADATGALPDPAPTGVREGADDDLHSDGSSTEDEEAGGGSDGEGEAGEASLLTVAAAEAATTDPLLDALRRFMMGRVDVRAAEAEGETVGGLSSTQEALLDAAEAVAHPEPPPSAAVQAPATNRRRAKQDWRGTANRGGRAGGGGDDPVPPPQDPLGAALEAQLAKTAAGAAGGVVRHSGNDPELRRWFEEGGPVNLLRDGGGATAALVAAEAVAEAEAAAAAGPGTPAAAAAPSTPHPTVRFSDEAVGEAN